MRIKTLIASLIMSVFAGVSAYSAEFRVGVAAAITSLGASGTETLKSSSNTTNTTHHETVMFVPSFFAEIGNDAGFSLGVDYIPVEEMGSESETRPDTDTNDDGDTSGTNTASADIESHLTMYISKTLGDSGIFLKVGYAQADVITKENLATGTSYGDASIDGILLGLGVHKQSDSGAFVRIEGNYTDYDDISLTGAADADSVSNSISADIDALAFKLSVGKAF